MSVGRDCDGFHKLASIAERTDGSEEKVVIEQISGTLKACDENVRQGDIVPSPVLGLPQITGNSVVTVCFEDPKYEKGFVFPAIKLAGAVDPPKVLKQGYQGNDNNYRPMTGMVRQEWHKGPRMDQAGHRMVNHYSGHNSHSSNRESGYTTVGFDYNQQRNQSQQQGPWAGGYVPSGGQYQGGSHRGGGGRGGYNGGGGGGGGYGNNRGGGGGGYNRNDNRYGGGANGQYQGGGGGHRGGERGGGGNNNYRGRGGGGGGGYNSYNNQQRRY